MPTLLPQRARDNICHCSPLVRDISWRQLLSHHFDLVAAHDGPQSGERSEMRDRKTVRA
jgi:hypothetical protein